MSREIEFLPDDLTNILVTARENGNYDVQILWLDIDGDVEDINIIFDLPEADVRTIVVNEFDISYHEYLRRLPKWTPKSRTITDIGESNEQSA